MKPLELSEDQRVKLLEMCQVLFPEYSFWWEYEMYGRGLKQDFNDVLCILKSNSKSFGFNIHWFEFCLTALWIKITALNRHTTPEELMKMYSIYWDITNRIIHPVDYLYNEFKKL